MGLASINVRIGADIRAFSTSMQNATRKMKKLGRAMTKTGKNLSRNISLPLAVLGGVAVKTFADFEQGMAKVKAVSGATATEFQALQKNAEDLGASTRFTATQVAELQLNYSKLGFSASEIVKVTDATLDLALATGEDLARSAEIAGATLRGFDLSVEETARVVDVMALSFSSSALDLEKFGESMKFVAPIANAINKSIEATTAALSVMADAGVSGSMAGTSLRQMFIELEKKGLSLEEALAQVAKSGFSVSEAVGLVGKRAATGLIVLAKNQDKLEKLTKEYENAAGAAKGMAKIMDDTLEGAMFKVRSAMEGMGISIGRVLMPMIKKLGNFVIGLANGFKELDGRTQKIILVVVGVVAALGPLLTMMGLMMTTVIPGLISAWVSLTSIMATNPLTTILIVAAAVTTAIIALTRRTKDFEGATSRMAKANEQATKGMAEEKVKLNTLNAALKVTNQGTKDRKRLIDEINTTYSDYLPKLLTEKSSTKDIGDALKVINEEVGKRIKLEAFREELIKALREQVQLQLKEKKLLADIAEEKKNPIWKQDLKNVLDAATSTNQLNAALGRVRKQLIQAKEPIDTLTKAYQDLWLEASKGGKDKVPPIVPEGTKETLEKLELALKDVDNRFIVHGSTIDVASEKVKLLMEAQVKLLNNGLEPTDKAFIKLGKDVETFKNEMYAANASVNQINPPLSELGEGLESAGAEIKQLGRQFVKTWDMISNAVITATRQMSSIITELTDRQIRKNDEQRAKFLDNIDMMSDGSDAWNNYREALEEEFDRKRKELVLKAAKRDKALALMEITVSTAAAVMNGLRSAPFPYNLVLAGIAATMGTVQTAVAASAPLPTLAEGGLAFAPSLAMVGDNMRANIDPEVIAPLSKLKDMMGSNKQHVVVEGIISGRNIFLTNQRYLKDNQRLQ